MEYERCNGCGICEQVCPANVFRLVHGRVSFDDSDCIDCKNCETSCPMGCISISAKKLQ